MDPYLTPSGIRFNDYFFSEPTRLREWIPPRYAGLYAILAADPNWAPKPFQPQYFGEFGNNTPPAAWWNEYRPMPGEADPRELFIAVLPMPFSTTAQRLAVRNELVSAYHPPCQMDSDKKAEDVVFVAPPARRRIGFLPLTEPAG